MVRIHLPPAVSQANFRIAPLARPDLVERQPELLAHHPPLNPLSLWSLVTTRAGAATTVKRRSRAPKRSLSLQTPPLITFFNCTYGR